MFEYDEPRGRITVNLALLRASFNRVTATQSAQPAVPVETGRLAVAPHDGADRLTTRTAPHRAQLPNPRIARPHGLPRAARPGNVPAPDHHHLPGWVRRAHAQAQPILADLLGSLEGDRRNELAGRVDGLVAAISAGKFSQAWFYPRLVDEGQGLLEAQQRENADAARARQAVDASRRRVSDQLREHANRLPSDAAGRLNRALRSAGDHDAVVAVAGEVERAVGSLRTGEERRRDREIGRTRARILKRLPRSAPVESAGETWQDTLRRFAEQQAAEGS